MNAFIIPALIVACAQGAVMTGVFFISGQLLPTALAAVYAAMPSVIWRTVAASIVIFPICNGLMGYTFANFNPAYVSPMTAAFAVLANVGFTILVIGARPSPWIIPALGLLAGSAVWVSFLLQQKPA